MEAAGLVLSAFQSLFAALKCSELKDLFSKFGHQSELEKLEETIEAVKCGLLDAQNAKGELNRQSKHLLEKLTPVVYDADDLLDKFTTVAKREMQRLAVIEEAGGRSRSKRLLKKVHSQSSSFKLCTLASKMSPEIQKIRNKLNKITNDANILRLIIVDANNLGINFDNQVIREWREPACSHVDEKSIIGREDDTRMIVDMLLDPNFEDQSDRQPPVLSIVGVGGMGKTALAQLVFNNKTIEAEFPLRLWVCVADQDQSQLSVQNVLGSILKSATNEKHIDTLSIEQLQKRIREKLDGNKYLLVLDDIWTDKREELLNLKQFFMGCRRGSRIVVTTRSRITAERIGSSDKLTYELQGLSDNNSWRLFEVLVEEEQANCPDLVDTGRSIVKKCANVPLAIKVIGTLLYRQDKSKWRSIHNSNLFEIENGDNNIKKILIFSYHHLTPSLKSCFSYCAIFPKDHVIEKEMLISLWMAQGYVEPLYRGQSMEDASAENFLILVRRCFFHDIIKDEYGEIVSCKIHDLMHDVALAVTKKEICIADVDSMSSLDENIRHVSKAPRYCVNSFSTMSKLRTYVDDHFHWESKRPVQLALGELLAKLKCLRALDLSHWEIQSLPDTIDGLLQLRYLDLSNNVELEVLPKSITQLHNLQTLLLVGCSKLRKLPSDSSRLVNLRVLDITNCHGLKYMPPGMKTLTCLCKLGMFIVGGRSSKQRFGELEDLGGLNKLKGSLGIHISKEYRYEKEKHGEGGRCLIDKEHLNGIEIRWDNGSSYEGVVQEQEALLEDKLQPHRNLKMLSIRHYKGERIAMWVKEDKLTTSLPNLVSIELSCCKGLKELPWVSKLGCLKRLTLTALENVEYMEENKNTSSYGGDGERESSSVTFFPALEELVLIYLPKLKGWWGGSGVDSDSNRQPAASVVLPLPCFPRLSELHIVRCRDLTSFPPCPNLETLKLREGVNERLRIITTKEEEDMSGGSIICSSSWSSTHPKLWKVAVFKNVGNLKWVQRGAFRYLREMVIVFDSEVESLSEIDEEVFRTSSSSLQSLQIECCNKLRSVSGGGLEHLTALEQLTLCRLLELSLNEDDMPWRSFGQSLHELKLEELTKMEKLPKGMRHLTSLHSLNIYNCFELEELPNWIGDGCFSSLQSLEIWDCPKMESLPDAMRNLTSLTTLRIWFCPPILEERCRSPDGEDWPKIRHIPNIWVGERGFEGNDFEC